MNEFSDVAVIGGGLAGGVSAYHLAKAGMRVTLFEKEKSPHHKVCGEFISGEGLPILKGMAINPLEMGGALISHFRIHGPKRSFGAKLPIAAVGLSRLRLDQEVLIAAERAGARLISGELIKSVEEVAFDSAEDEKKAFLLKGSTGDFRSRQLIVATGKNEFRSVQNREGLDSGLVGFKMHLRLKPSEYRKLANHVDLLVFENGYGGLAPIEEGKVNFSFLIRREALRKIGSDYESLAYYIGKSNWAASQYLDGAEPLLDQLVSVARVPYGFLRRTRPEPGLFCVGDQMAVIPSLTGDGMAIAMSTGKAAAQSIANSLSSQKYQAEMRRLLGPQVMTGFYLHRVFMNPKLTDLGAFLIPKVPGLVGTLFRKTRFNQAQFGVHFSELGLGRLRAGNMKRLRS